MRGGSTITQQLAKNLLLSGERTLLRKGQELVLTALEVLLDKQRILEIYLNNVEWGEGVFGAEAAAQHYFSDGAGALGAMRSGAARGDAAAPKFFESGPARPTSPAARRRSSRAWATSNCPDADRQLLCAAPRMRRMSGSLSAEIAAAAARLVVEEGMEYGAAKRKAARDLARGALRSASCRATTTVEDEVRAYIAAVLRRHAARRTGRAARARRCAGWSAWPSSGRT